MGVRVDLFTRAGAGGERSFTLVEAFGDEVVGPFEPDERAPAVVLVRETFSFGEHARAYLAEQQTPGEWQPMKRPGMLGPMANGRFLWTSDGRFRQLSEQPVPLHDRWETPEQYASYD